MVFIPRKCYNISYSFVFLNPVKRYVWQWRIFPFLYVAECTSLPVYLNWLTATAATIQL